MICSFQRCSSAAWAASAVTTMSLRSTSARSRRIPSPPVGSMTTPRLFALNAIHVRLRSGPATPATKGGMSRSGSPPGGSTFTTSAPRSARMRAQNAAAASASARSTSSTTRTPSSIALIPLASAAREDLRPASHDRLRLLDVAAGEPACRIDAIDRVDRSHEIVLEAVRHCRIDPHPALEAGVHRGPLRVSCGEALLRDEGLPGAPGYGTPEVDARVHARRERPDDVVHRVDVDVAVDGDAQAQPRAARERRGDEIAHPAVVGLEALLHLQDAAGPIGHRERDVHVVDQPRL